MRTARAAVKLATYRRARRFTGWQALHAILFLYRDVLSRPVGFVPEIAPARRRVRLPVVLSQAEVKSILVRMRGGCRRDHVVILGRGSNARFSNHLNDEYGWFDQVHSVDYPRFIMQYRRKRLLEYLEIYANLLTLIA